jgi:hypothetical protein
MQLQIGLSLLLFGSQVVSQSCVPVHLIVARGSFESQGEGIASSLSSLIKRSVPGATSEALVYPAVMPYSGSMDVGTERIKQIIAKYAKSCPQTKLVLLGYSQGGAVIVDALCGASYNSKIGKHTNGLTKEEGKQIVLALSFGDPRFVPGMPYNLGTNSKSPGVSSLHSVRCLSCNQFAANFENYNIKDADYLKLFARDNKEAQCPLFGRIIKSWCDANDSRCASGSSLQVHLSYINKYSNVALQYVLQALKA